MRTINIEGKVYKLVYNLKGLFTYEAMAGHPYKGEKTIDNYFLLYAMLLANNGEFVMEFDSLIEACDKDLEIFHTFMDVMNDEAVRVSAFQDKKKAMKVQ